MQTFIKFTITLIKMFIIFTLCVVFITFDLSYFYPGNWEPVLRSVALIITTTITIIAMLDKDTLL